MSKVHTKLKEIWKEDATINHKNPFRKLANSNYLMKLGEKLKEYMGKPREEMSARCGYDCSDVELDPSSSESDASLTPRSVKKTSQDLNRKEVKKMLKRSLF